MSSPRTSRACDITNTAGPSNHKVYPSSRSRRSSSSIRHRPRNESSASLLTYDPDAYTDDLIPQDVIFDGPSASSVPTSVSNFAHRGSRASFADDDRALRFFAAEFDSDAEDILTEVDPEEFRTRRGRLWIYRVLCILTFGMMYLLLRWLPRWRLKFLAEPLPLSEAHWVVVEVPPLQILLLI